MLKDRNSFLVSTLHPDLPGSWWSIRTGRSERNNSRGRTTSQIRAADLRTKTLRENPGDPVRSGGVTVLYIGVKNGIKELASARKNETLQWAALRRRYDEESRDEGLVLLRGRVEKVSKAGVVKSLDPIKGGAFIVSSCSGSKRFYGSRRTFSGHLPGR